ncbi:Acetylcholinesterase, partial [Leucoagaricus sp. SymC.cos]
PAYDAFTPLLKKNWASIEAVRRETFKYGTEDRHHLDIYFPPTVQTEKTPVVFWIYGGGFITGARVLPPPVETLYPNIGAFFAHQGFITVVADYRLVCPPWSAQYPKPVEDIRDAVSWVVAHPKELTTSTTPNPDVDSIFLFGNSAGGTHLGSLVFDTNVIPPDSHLRDRIKGAILIAGLYYNDARSRFEPEMQLYYGDKLDSHSVISLLRAAKGNGLTKLPKIMLAEAENEPQAFKEIRKNFQDELNAFLGESVPLVIAKNHNHISLNCCPSSGVGEEWAIEAAKWIRANV